jgi:hypothetical protein
MHACMHACMNALHERVTAGAGEESRAHLQRQFLNSVIITEFRNPRSRQNSRVWVWRTRHLSEHKSVRERCGKAAAQQPPRPEHVNERHDEFLNPCIKCSTDVNFYKAKLFRITMKFSSDVHGNQAGRAARTPVRVRHETCYRF